MTPPLPTPKQKDPAASKRNRFAPIVLTCVAVGGLVWYLQDQAGLQRLQVSSRSPYQDQTNQLMIDSRNKVGLGMSRPLLKRSMPLLTNQHHDYEALLRAGAGEEPLVSEPADMRAYPKLKRIRGLSRQSGQVREAFSLWQMNEHASDTSADLSGMVAFYTDQALGKGYRLLPADQSAAGVSQVAVQVNLRFVKTTSGHRQFLLVRLDAQSDPLRVLIWLKVTPKR